jgi:hypothetical protein
VLLLGDAIFGNFNGRKQTRFSAPHIMRFSAVPSLTKKTTTAGPPPIFNHHLQIHTKKLSGVVL